MINSNACNRVPISTICIRCKFPMIPLINLIANGPRACIAILNSKQAIAIDEFQ